MYAGDNFLGIVYRVTCSSEDERNTTSLFVKMAPQDAAKRNILNIHQCFMRETFIYEVLLPRFREFQESRNVSGDDGFHEFAKCFKAVNTEPIETMFFEVIVFHFL